MTPLSRLTVGDVVTFKNESGKARFRRVLTAMGRGDYRTYNLSSASKSADGKSLRSSFVNMTAYELAKSNYAMA